MLIRVSTPAHCVVCDGPGWLRDVDHRGVAFAAVCDGCVPPAARPPLPQPATATPSFNAWFVAAVILYILTPFLAEPGAMLNPLTFLAGTFCFAAGIGRARAETRRR